MSLSSRPSRTVWAINGAGEAPSRVLRPARPSRARLFAAAGKSTGLTDWGDENFLAPLDHLLDAFEREADPSLIGRLAVRSNLLRLLSNRLKIQRDVVRAPGILDGAGGGKDLRC